MTKLKDDEGNEKVIIGEATPIRVGLVIMFLSIFAAGIWWGATVTSKLDSIIQFQSAQTVAFSELQTKVEDLKVRVILNETEVKSLREKYVKP